MNIIRIEYPISHSSLTDLAGEGLSLAIGDFDGVHHGHQKVIGQAVETARKRGLSASVMTFHPHPREVLGHIAYSTYITPLQRKLDRFSEIGVDHVLLVTFNEAFSRLTPETFVNNVLIPLNVKHISVGFNFTFGHRGSGTADLLERLGAGAFNVTVVNPCLKNGERVSSTQIREALAKGDVDRAEMLLGRPYSVSGTVVPGEGRGRTIGVPTANLELDNAYVVPANGVYAVDVLIQSGPFAGVKAAGVMNVGLKPTFRDDMKKPTWEVNLFDFSGDLYGERLTVLFRSRIREERKFRSVEHLVQQIQQDIVRAKQIPRLAHM